MDKKCIVNDLYHASLISDFAVGYSMLDKNILRMAPPSIQRFNLEDTEKLVAIVSVENGECSDVDWRCISSYFYW